MKTTLIALAIFTLPSYSQVTLSTHLGIDPSTNFLDDDSDFISSHCRPGITATLASEVFLSTSIALTPSIEFANYSLDPNTSPIITTIPEYRVTSVTGEDSQVWRFAFQARHVVAPQSDLSLNLSTGVGYVVERSRLISATFQDISGPDFTNTFKSKGENYFVHMMGLGVRRIVSTYFALDLRGHLFTNYSDRMTTTVSIGVVYTLTK